MKKLMMLLSVLALAVSASACSESPTAIDTDVPLTSGEAWTWTKPTTDTTKKPKSQLPDNNKTSSGYALGM